MANFWGERNLLERRVGGLGILRTSELRGFFYKRLTLEAIASRWEAIANRWEAIAIRLSLSLTLLSTFRLWSPASPVSSFFRSSSSTTETFSNSRAHSFGAWPQRCSGSVGVAARPVNDLMRYWSWGHNRNTTRLEAVRNTVLPCFTWFY